jgi:hypothetical protein
VETTPYLINKKRSVHVLPVQSVQSGEEKPINGDVNTSTLYEAASFKMHVEQWTRGEHRRHTTDRVERKILTRVSTRGGASGSMAGIMGIILVLVDTGRYGGLCSAFRMVQLHRQRSPILETLERDIWCDAVWRAETHLIEHPNSWSTRVL